MNTCYDCMNLRCKIPIENGKLIYKRATAWCRKNNLTKDNALQTRYWQCVIPEIPKVAFNVAGRCIDFENMKEE